MANENYEAGKITIQHEYRFTEIKEWVKFQEQKQKIQDKYPNKPWEVHISSGQGNHKDPFEQGWWEEWQKYKKEITDLILKPNGNFTKFLYKIRPEKQDAEVRIWLRGKFNTEAKQKKRS